MKKVAYRAFKGHSRGFFTKDKSFMKNNKSLSGTGIIKFKKTRGGKINTTINAASLYVLVNNERTRRLKTLDILYKRITHTTPFMMDGKTITPKWVSMDEGNRIFEFLVTTLDDNPDESILIFLDTREVSYLKIISGK